MLSVRDLALHQHIGFGTGASWRRRRASVRLPASVQKRDNRACATLPCRDRERERHSSTAAPGGQRPRGYRSGVQPPMQQNPIPRDCVGTGLVFTAPRLAVCGLAKIADQRLGLRAKRSTRAALGATRTTLRLLGIRPTASYVSCMHKQRMLSRQFPRKSTNGKQSTGALLHASRRDAATGRGMRKQPLEIHHDPA